MADTIVIEDPGRGVRLDVLAEGEGEPVVLVPSAIRGAADFALLQRALTADITLRDLADDVAFVVAQLGSGRAHLVGHALGNIVVRATASYRPEVAATVAVMPCGGHSLGAHPVPPEVLVAFPRCHDETLSDDERLEALRAAFFAAGNDARSWLKGWWPGSAFGAVVRTDPEEWWRAGNAPILIIQPREDAMAPTAVGREALAVIGERATYVEIPGCGHAILPEQPDAIAANVVAFLRAHPLDQRHVSPR